MNFSERPCFCSSFRDWPGNVSNFPREITETALAHVTGDNGRASLYVVRDLAAHQTTIAIYRMPTIPSGVYPIAAYGRASFHGDAGVLGKSHPHGARSSEMSNKIALVSLDFVGTASMCAGSKGGRWIRS
jgi:hypothetical protein